MVVSPSPVVVLVVDVVVVVVVVVVVLVEVVLVVALVEVVVVGSEVVVVLDVVVVVVVVVVGSVVVVVVVVTVVVVVDGTGHTPAVSGFDALKSFVPSFFRTASPPKSALYRSPAPSGASWSATQPPVPEFGGMRSTGPSLPWTSVFKVAVPLDETAIWRILTGPFTPPEST